MDLIFFVLCLVVAVLAGLHLHLTIKKRNEPTNQKLPPGPPPLPIFGNLFSLGTKPHVSLAEFAKSYGPLMMLKLGQVPTVIISSAAMAKEALQRNDHYFCNRHVIDAIRALNYHEHSMAWLPASSSEGSQWRTLRRICNSQVFSKSRLDASQGLRRSKVKDLLSYVEKSSEDGTAVDIGQASFTTFLNLLSNTLFSADLGDPTSVFANELRSTTRRLLEELGKPNFADFFPILRNMDPQGIRRRTGVHLKKIMYIYKSMIDQRLAGERPSGIVPGDDVLDALLGTSHKSEEILEPSKIAYLFSDLFFGGTDTTTTTIEWALAELMHNPDKLKKAQLELRQTIGIGNQLEEHDLSQLPYLQAIVKETLRLHPPLPLLVPRNVDADVKLVDYSIPKNTQIMINVWAIGRDPCLWENPTCFEPERFLGAEVNFIGGDFGLIPFGAGRRICPGLPLANRMVPLVLGSLIHGFDWKLEGGTSPENMDMEEKFGISLEKAQRLRVIPVRV